MEEGTECERSVFHAKREREQVSAKPIERHQEVAEERVRGADPLGGEGASEPAVDTCCLISAVAIRKAPVSPNNCRSPVWNAIKRLYRASNFLK